MAGPSRSVIKDQMIGIGGNSKIIMGKNNLSEEQIKEFDRLMGEGHYMQAAELIMGIRNNNDGDNSMNADQYQAAAARTLISTPPDLTNPEMMILWNSIGLAGEAGEICEIVKKGILHQHGIDPLKMSEEIGDLMWYISALCTKCGLNLGKIMEMNIEKLRRRYPEGWDYSKSHHQER